MAACSRAVRTAIASRVGDSRLEDRTRLSLSQAGPERHYRVVLAGPGTSRGGGSRDAAAAEARTRAPELTRRVRAARAYSGLSVGELAAAIGVGAQTVKRIEAGRRNPRQMEVWAIADVCGLPR